MRNATSQRAIVHMEHVAPLIESILWVGLFGAILWRFHRLIEGILSALQKRIAHGSTVKAGWLEIADQLRPQDPVSQQAKAAEEIREGLLDEGQPPPAVPHAGQPPSANLRRQHFQVEDLALRAIQAEYGATVSRQVTAGADSGFDGVFVIKDRLNIVEVKYLRSLKTVSKLRDTLERIEAAVRRYQWGNVQIVLVAVFEHPSDLGEGVSRLQEVATGLSMPVAVRCYALADLQRRFGISDEFSHPSPAG